MSLKSAVLDFISAGNFIPKWRGILFNPFYISRRELYFGVKHFAHELNGKILDFGAGTHPYRHLLTNCSEYVSLEYDTPKNREHKVADIFYDGVHIPVPDESFDGILSTQTIEHVPNPREITQEWMRILHNGGGVLITVPFMWPEHELPYDFQRYASAGICKLLEEAGFKIIEQKRLAVGSKAIFQLFIAWLYDTIFAHTHSYKLNLILNILLVAPITLLSELLSLIPCKENKTYLDNIILARKV